MLEYLDFFLNTERLLSLLLVTVVLGFGVWFARSGWPFLSEYLKQSQRLNHELRLARLEAEFESDKRWQLTTQQMATAFTELRVEIATLTQILLDRTTKS